MGDMTLPRNVRWPTQPEWTLVTRVFGNTLPFRQRVFITDGLGGGGAPFTIPTAAVRAALPTLVSALGGGLVAGPAGAALAAAVSGTIGYLTSAVNLGYIMNIGTANYADMMGSDYGRRLLVHETAHVWQGKNSTFALSYVISSALAQCASMARGGGGLESRGGAYDYTPGQPWNSYNAEQQAKIVENWYEAEMPESGDLWPYIQNHIRTGSA